MPTGDEIWDLMRKPYNPGCARKGKPIKMNRHYKRLEPIITKYFGRKGISVAIEPHGSQSADLEGTGNTLLAGEIKHVHELRRDLPNKFWRDWNSTQSFGGKISNYLLNGDLQLRESDHDGCTLSWIAVIYGQLNHYRRKQSLRMGWLVFEGFAEFYHGLQTALSVLRALGKIEAFSIEEFDGLGFVKIVFE